MEVALSDSITHSRRGKFGSNLFWGQTAPEKVIHTYNLIVSGDTSYISLKKKGLRNALEILSGTKGIMKVEDNVDITKSINEILNYISKTETIVLVNKMLDENNNLKGKEIGEQLNTHLGRKWKSSSMIRYGNALLKWAKCLNNDAVACTKANTVK